MAEKKLVTLVCKFLDDIISAVPEETDLLLLRALIVSISSELLMKNFMVYVYPHREKIRNKDESFFLSNENIFNELEKSKANHFKKIWEGHRLSAEDKEAIWKWFSAFILVCEQAKKRM